MLMEYSNSRFHMFIKITIRSGNSPHMSLIHLHHSCVSLQCRCECTFVTAWRLPRKWRTAATTGTRPTAPGSCSRTCATKCSPSCQVTSESSRSLDNSVCAHQTCATHILPVWTEWPPLCPFFCWGSYLNISCYRLVNDIIMYLTTSIHTILYIMMWL